jgi:hypothetical protein
MTTLADRVSLDEVNAQAREVRTGRALLSVVAALFFAVGWLAGRIIPLLMWCVFAVREGYRASHGPSRRMRLEAQAVEIRELKMQLSRFVG